MKNIRIGIVVCMLLITSFSISTTAIVNIKESYSSINLSSHVSEILLTDWYLQTSWDTSGLFGFYFSSNDVGWAVGVGTILHTSDGGNIWFEQDYPAASNLYSVFFINNYIGWTSGSNGVILHTTDGGNTWVEQDHSFTNGGYFFSGLYFLDANNGWAVGGKPYTYNSPNKRVILHTTDGGDTWVTNLYESYTSRLLAVYFTDTNNGWAVGEYDQYSGHVLHTSNGGATWVVQDPGVTSHLTDVHFTDSNNGWIIGGFGLLLHTTNGGDTWTSEDPGTSDSLSGIHFIDGQNGWIAGGNNNDATIMHTNDGGGTWTADNPGTTNFLYDIFLTDSTHGWAGGIHGDIVSTIQTSNTPPDQPFDPIPSDGETNVNLDPTLSVKVTDPNSDTLTVSFYDASDNSLIGTDNNVVSGDRAYIIWNDLESSTTYNWYVVADDGEDSTQSPTWSFTTTGANQPPNEPTNPMPPNGATDVELNPTLCVKLTDPNIDSMTGRFYDASDNSLIGIDYGVPSGDMAYVTWSGLSPETTYSWYSKADDGEYITQSNTWSFTTCCANQPPNSPIFPIPSDGATGVGLNPPLSVEVNDPDADSMTVRFYDASDNSLIGMDDGVTSGNRAIVIWPNLSPSVTYSWYAVADDGEYTNQSDIWEFTTDSVNNAPLAPTNPLPSDGATGVGLNPTLSVEVNDPDADSMTVRFYDASDDSLIGMDDDVISGGRAYTPWNGLSPSTSYDWYAVADDGEYTTQSDTWSFTTGAENNAPLEPTNPIPLNDATGVDLNSTLSVEVNDPDADSMTVRFYDARDDSLIGTDFNVPSGSRAYMGWFNLEPLSMYSWYAVADDGEYTTQSDTWSFVTIQDPDNNPPSTPTILGPERGKPGIEYTYTFNSVDPDGDDIVYCIQWGDDTEICLGPYPSGEDVVATHIYEEKGGYTIRAKAEDSNEAESDWGTLKIEMPKNKAFKFNFPLLNWLFERFPNTFPLLRYLLGL
ncbi:MAG: PKD domain-containing protein [Thermoplasmatales archaeon]|nr:MAG: PKD domain-containing protein [Thermoplasmatales archaeon]